MIPQVAVELVKAFEGYHRRLSDGSVEPYRCPANVLTAGWGHTGPDVQSGRTYTRAQAELWLDKDLAAAALAAVRLCPVLAANPEALGAVTSFIFNLGAGAFQASTLRRRILAGDWRGAGDEFLRWVNAGGRRLDGLVRRREAERLLFLSRAQ